MAEPILGQALALQSEFRPDTSQVLTRAVDKIGNVTLKKQLAAAKAAETKAKREQDIMASINLKAGKLGVHYVGDAQKLLTQGISEITEATQKGDLAKKVLLEGQYQTALDNLVFENNLLENFKKTKQQGGLIPDEVELGFSMPRAQANEYFKKLLTERPEFRFVFDQTPEGYYKFNPVKQINEAEEYGKIINANKSEYAVQSIKRQDGKDIVSYKIPDARINDLANLLANDKNYVINALINNTKAVNNEVQAALQANPALTKEEAEEIGIKSYFVKNLQSANQDFSISNTPKPKSGLEMNFGSGFKTASGWIVTPTSGTRVKEEDPTLIDRLKVLNIARRKAGKKTLTYQEAYGTPEADYDEIYFENKDVPENKTFKIPDGKGGFFDMIPVAVRRQSGVDKKTNKDFPWKLSGRIPKTEDEEERNVSIELTPDVVAKLDGILGTSTRDIINEVQGKKSAPKIIRQGTPAPKAGTATVKGGKVR